MTNKQQKFEIAEPEQPVGTEILDGNMPSNLDFDDKPSKEVEMSQMGAGKQPQSASNAALSAVQIRSYVVKGKSIFDLEPKHNVGAVLQGNAHSFAVRAYDDEPSGGWKRLWQALVGYCSRELLFEGGFIYLLQNEGKGASRVVARWRLIDLFKVYVDPEDSRVRLVLREAQHIVNKDYTSAFTKQIVEVLTEQLGAIGLVMSGG